MNHGTVTLINGSTFADCGIIKGDIIHLSFGTFVLRENRWQWIVDGRVEFKPFNNQEELIHFLRLQ